MSESKYRCHSHIGTFSIILQAQDLFNLEREKNRKFFVVIRLSLSDFNERFDSKMTRKWSELKGVIVTL